ncbi:hypothetical protein JCM11641_001647 [Rhodosporidiobolus odoratus]
MALYCGACASDLHTISNGWGYTSYPQVIGDEIFGTVVRAGSQVKHLKEGDLVGVGAQNDSCLACENCKANRERYCDRGAIGTYNATYYREGPDKGQKSWGGYADYHRAPAHFVLKIPDGLDPAIAAPMLCGGVTVFSPLKHYGAYNEAKDVGIIGIGGLGHFGLLFSQALGANVTAISHSESKRADAEKMGADRFIATHSGNQDDFKPHFRSLDLIIATSNDEKMPLDGYLSHLRPYGKLVLVGVPEAPLPTITPFQLIANGVALAGSAIGSPSEIRDMLALAAAQNVKSWIVKKPIEEANEVVVKVHQEGARYRYVLVKQKNGGKLLSWRRKK